MQPNIITKDDIYDRICVDRPYFSLEELSIGQERGSVTAIVKFESYNIYEQGPSSAEIGRHLAILGSCALASLNTTPEKYYYLVISATQIRHQVYSFDNGDVFIAAKAEYASSRVGVASMSMRTLEGLLIAELTCHYNVIPAPTFERMSRAYYCATTGPSSFNPYSRSIPVTNKVIDGDWASAIVHRIDHEYCVGHFDHYPALPVAMVMDAMNRLIGEHLAETINASRFYFLKCTITARALAFAGSSISFLVRVSNHIGNTVTYEGRAYNSGDNATYGDVVVTYMYM